MPVLAVVAGHPLGRASYQLLSVTLQFCQVVERVSAAQLAGVNQAHEQVPHLRSVQGPVEQSVLPVQNDPFQCPFDDIGVTPPFVKNCTLSP